MHVTTRIDMSEIRLFGLTDAVRRAQEEIGSSMARDVRDAASRLVSRSGEYADGWTWRREGDVLRVYNGGRKAPLAHLLEFGHAVVNKYGTHGYWRPPAPHIGPAYEKAKADYMDRLKQAARESLGG